MEAPINVVVESPNAEQAELVGRAIAQGLKDNFGFEQVVQAHIISDSPGFRAWKLQTEDVEQETLYNAMVAHNPGIFQVPVTVLSRENQNPAEINTDTLPRITDAPVNVFRLDGIGEMGVSFEEAREAEMARIEAKARPQLQALAEKMAADFTPSKVTEF